MPKGLQSTPPSQLALPAAGGDNDHKVAKVKPSKKGNSGASTGQPAVPGPVDSGTVNKPKARCVLHAAGHCRFGDKCRNQHNGDAGPDLARKAHADFQKGKDQGGDKSGKGKGKSKNKGDSKGKNKSDGKATKGSSSASPAAVATAASTVTIAEVQGRSAQEAWK